MNNGEQCVRVKEVKKKLTKREQKEQWRRRRRRRRMRWRNDDELNSSRKRHWTEMKWIDITKQPEKGNSLPNGQQRLASCSLLPSPLRQQQEYCAGSSGNNNIRSAASAVITPTITAIRGEARTIQVHCYPWKRHKWVDGRKDNEKVVVPWWYYSGTYWQWQWWRRSNVPKRACWA